MIDKRVLDRAMELLDSLSVPELDKGIKDQIGNFLAAAIHIGFRYQKDWEKILAILGFKIMQFFYSRDQRVAELASPEVKKAITIKRSLYFGERPYLLACMDGRVLAKIMFGLHGYSLRTGAARLEMDFLPDVDGNGMFLREGIFTEMLRSAFSRASNNCVTEIFDSHLFCAAGGVISGDLRLCEVYDYGLVDDVLEKSRMSEALKNYVSHNFSGKKIVVIQTSYNPKDGYCFMGLEKNLDDPRVMETGFTEELLDVFVKEKKIISSKSIVEEFYDAFRDNYFFVDYEKEYVKSSLQFWSRLRDKMSYLLSSPLEEKIKELFGKIDEYELRQRCVLLMSSAFSGFLFNHRQDLTERPFPYLEHRESVIAITFSEKGPFDRADAFSIEPSDPMLSRNLKLGGDIVRSNRQKGMMSAYEKDAINKLEIGDDYQTFPVLAFTFERLNEFPSDTVINSLRKMNCSDLPGIDWMGMSEREFLLYLEKKYTDIPAVIANKIESLRQRAIDLYRPGTDITHSLLSGNLFPVFVLTGPERETIAVFPFLAKGYRK